MTKKDYELIAKAIRRVKDEILGNIGCNDLDDVVEATVDSLIYSLIQDNPRFDEDKFRVACLGE